MPYCYCKSGVLYRYKKVCFLEGSKCRWATPEKGVAFLCPKAPLSIAAILSKKKMTIRHFKGFHFSFPFILRRIKPVDLEWQVVFSDESKYDVDVDQSDWNKLLGVKWDYFKPREDAIMCGWRYDIATDLFDLCMYVHENGSYNPYAQKLLSVKSHASIQISFNEAEKKVVFFVSETAEDRVRVELDWAAFGTAWIINSWFGGNRTPNKMISFDLKRL